MATPSTPQTLPGISDEQIDAYLKAQRETVEEADRAWGRPNVGGLHTNTVREACRNGLMAALAAKPAPSSVTEIVSLMMPYVRACTRFCNTPRGQIDAAEAEVQAEFKPLEAALTALVEERDRLRFALDGVNAMAKLEQREPLSEEQIDVLYKSARPDCGALAFRRIIRCTEICHGIGATQSTEGKAS